MALVGGGSAATDSVGRVEEVVEISTSHGVRCADSMVERQSAADDDAILPYLDACLIT